MKTRSRSTPNFAGTLAALLVLCTSLVTTADEPPAARDAPIDPSPPALEVHEWGTFTVLEGSDGQVIEWYQAPDKLVDLPSFVGLASGFRIAGKSGTVRWGGRMDTIRMETPVLYFYPQDPMDVTVRASFPMGRITEVFPPALASTPAETTWHGTLLPPDSPERSKIPVATGPKGRHYGAARKVPGAWLFRNTPLPAVPPEQTTSTTPDSRALEDTKLVALPPAANPDPNPAAAKPTIEPIDHFIFYRGAGNRGSFELTAVQGEGPDTFTLTNRSRATIPKLFALRVSEGQTAWLSLDQLTAVEYQEGKLLNQQTFTFPAPAGPAIEVAAELRRAMIDSLHAQGLTPEEAAAMVATWDDLWFTDPGTRILAVLPQTFADDMVPLTITPTPTSMVRVFVARVEIITREYEQTLTSLLNPATDTQDLASAAEQLQALQLGRYAAGGMERATTLVKRQIRERFTQLTRFAEEQQRLQASRE
jgi:hypothetical protein